MDSYGFFTWMTYLSIANPRLASNVTDVYLFTGGIAALQHVAPNLIV